MSRKDARGMLEAIERAHAKGVLFVAASGNEGNSNDKVETYPANAGLPNVIAVGSVGKDGKPNKWSNFSRERVDILAPGEGVLSTLPGNRYATWDGTSMSVPHISGAAAYLFGLDPSLTASEAKALILSSGEALESETRCGCRLDMLNLVQRFKNRTLTILEVPRQMKRGETFQVQYFGGTGSVVYSSSADNLLSVDENGVAVAKETGLVRLIIADQNGQKSESTPILIID